MKPNELIKNWTNRPNPNHEREIGAYYCSELWAIEKGYFKPEDFFKEREIDLDGAMNISGGIGDEDLLEKILLDLGIEHEHEPKKYVKIDEGIQIAVKPDFVFPNFILETKSPTKITTEIPDKWKYQLEMEGRAFGKDVYLGVFRNNLTRRFSLSVYRYKQSDETYAKIIKVVRGFHEKLRKL